MPRLPERVGFILGGTRLHGRLSLLERTISRADVICIGGPVATSLARSRCGVTTLGHNLQERGAVQRVATLLDAAEKRGALMITPLDVIAYRDYQSGRAYNCLAPEDVPLGWMPADTAPRTLSVFRNALLTTDTVIWSGPLGRAEEHPFARGSIALARVLSRVDPLGTPRLVLSGRDTVSVVRAAGVEVVASTAVATGRRAGAHPRALDPAGLAES